MSIWQIKPLGQLCLIERGGSPRPIDKYITDDPNGINWIKIGDTTESMYITRTKEKIIPEGMKKSRYVQKGDFLLSNSMSFGRPYILDIDGCIHDGWLVIRDVNNLFDKRFLYYFLGSPVIYQKFKSMAVGGVVNNLNIDMVKKVEVPVLPISEQREIADVFALVDELIKNKKHQLELFDELVKSRFIELFGTPLLNEKGWEVKSTGDVCSVTDGSHFSPVGKEDGYPMLSVRNMRNDGFHYDDCKLVSQEDYDILVKQGCKPLKNDVLIAKDGSYFYYGFVVKEEIEQAVLSSIAILRPNLEEINPEYLCRYMLSSEIVDLVGKNYVTGAAIKRVILKGIKQIPVMLPPMELQNQFAAFVEQTDKSKLAVQEALRHLEELKKSLMQQYFG